jgi:hypothetical protein
MLKYLPLLYFALVISSLSAQSVEFYYDDGTKKSMIPLNSKGIYEGIGYEYHPNGVIAAVIPYVDGKIEGIYREYYDDGNLKSECEYIAGEKDGIYSGYYRGGQLQISQHWVKGEKEGDMFVFYSNGMLRMYSLLENDSILFAQRFDDQGMLNREKISFIAAPIDTSRLPSPEIFCRYGHNLLKNKPNPVQVFIPQVPSKFISYASPSGKISRSEVNGFPLMLTPDPGVDEFILYLRIKTHSSARPIMMKMVKIPVI